MRVPKIPDNAEIIKTYAEFVSLVAAFFQGHYQLLVAIGRPGLSKSQEFMHRMGDTSHIIKGWIAPLRAYIETYQHRNKLLIFDDAEVLWKKPGGRILLRSITEHTPRKLVEWTSTVKDLENENVPRSFLTSSKVALIGNRFAFGRDEEYEAIIDRGHLIYFDPTPIEVHVNVGTWFWDQEIYDFIGQRLHLMDSLTSRTYLKVWERKKAGGDWRKLVEERFCHDTAMLLVQKLETKYKNVEERAKEFIKQTGLCRATYFNYKKQLESDDQIREIKRQDVPTTELRGSPPPELNMVAEVEAAKAETEQMEPKQEPSEGQQTHDADLRVFA